LLQDHVRLINGLFEGGGNPYGEGREKKENTISVLAGNPFQVLRGEQRPDQRRFAEPLLPPKKTAQ